MVLPPPPSSRCRTFTGCAYCVFHEKLTAVHVRCASPRGGGSGRPFPHVQGRHLPRAQVQRQEQGVSCGRPFIADHSIAFINCHSAQNMMRLMKWFETQ